MAKVKTEVGTSDGLVRVQVRGGQKVVSFDGVRWLNSITLELRVVDDNDRVLIVTRQINKFQEELLKIDVKKFFNDYLTWSSRVSETEKRRAIGLLTQHVELLREALALHWDKYFPAE